LKPFFKTEAIGNNQRCIAEASSLRGRGLKIVRVGAAWDEDLNAHGVAANLFDEVTHERGGGNDLRSTVAGLCG
jgi:hypothetical protein